VFLCHGRYTEHDGAHTLNWAALLSRILVTHNWVVSSFCVPLPHSIGLEKDARLRVVGDATGTACLTADSCSKCDMIRLLHHACCGRTAPINPNTQLQHRINTRTGSTPALDRHSHHYSLRRLPLCPPSKHKHNSELETEHDCVRGFVVFVSEEGQARA
jgi:hypothetical protein